MGLIDLVKLTEDMTVEDVTEMTLPMEPRRFRSVVSGLDGSLYAAVEEGTIYKLTPGNEMDLLRRHAWRRSFLAT